MFDYRLMNPFKSNELISLAEKIHYNVTDFLKAIFMFNAQC